MGENLLPHSLFLALGSMEVTAQLQIASILHVSAVVLMHCLVGNSHELAHWNWGECSLGHLIDLLYAACDEIKLKRKLFMDYEYMMNIFTPLQNDLPEFQGYLEYF